jgi:hypothetical protein
VSLFPAHANTGDPNQSGLTVPALSERSERQLRMVASSYWSVTVRSAKSDSEAVWSPEPSACQVGALTLGGGSEGVGVERPIECFFDLRFPRGRTKG